MKSPKMTFVMISIFAMIEMFMAIETYYFSFMREPAILVLCIMSITFTYFIDTWFYYIWGLFTGLVIVVPLIIALFNHSTNTTAYIYDGVLSLFFFTYFGYKVYKKLKSTN